MATLGISSDALLTNSAAYCKAWLKALKGDKKMIFMASGKAEKALDLVFG